jgi:2,3-diketo-5-methylthio-1-phosphopentane phosphatase
MALKVFADFDGTITRHDVGNEFFREFGGKVCDGIVQDYREGKISAQECFRREISAIGTISQQDAKEFLAQQVIDGSFKSFVEFCRAQGIALTIVSDGLDYYIVRILENHGLSDIAFFSNRLELQTLDGGDRCSLAIQFPYGDAECTRCGCCKRNIILTQAGDEDIIVYVGEGYSDFCPAQFADIVFAKDALQTFCQRENISYYSYQSFQDIEMRLAELLAKKGLRKRRRAELKRREVFVNE